MIASVFRLTGNFATVVLENKRTVTTDWYINKSFASCLTKISTAAPTKQGTSSLRKRYSAFRATESRIFYYGGCRDNESSLYSLDLVPCYFYLFPKIKDKLRSIRFRNPEDAVTAYEMAVEKIPKVEWAHCFSQ